MVTVTHIKKGVILSPSGHLPALASNFVVSNVGIIIGIMGEMLFKQGIRGRGKEWDACPMFHMLLSWGRSTPLIV